jgi:PAS domain S-box-containing protein
MRPAGRRPARSDDRLFRSLVEHGLDGVAILDETGSVRYISPAGLEILNIAEHEVRGASFDQLVVPDEVPRAREEFARLIARPDLPVRSQLRFRRRGGEPRVVAYVAHNRLARRDVQGIVINFTDISERDRAEQARRESEWLCQAIVTAASEGIVISDDQGLVVSANEAAAALLGLTPGEMVGRDAAELLHGVLAAARPRAFGETGRGRFTLQRHGLTRLVDYAGVARVLPGRHLTILRDVTEQVAAEGRFRGIFDSNVVNITIGDDRGNILDANDAFLSMLGYSREDVAAGRLRWTDLTPPEYLEANRRAHEDVKIFGHSGAFEKQYLRRDGSRVWVLINLAQLPTSPSHTVSVSTDISRKKELEDQVRHGQKMEAIGRLAGAVAHDFNNLLTVILGFAEGVTGHPGVPADALHDAQEVVRAAHSAAALTRQLLAFSRRQTYDARVLDLNQRIEQVRGLLDRLIGPEVEIVTTLQQPLPVVVADPSHIDQILVNLAVNARDAMATGGRLEIGTATAVLDDEFVRRHRGACPGSFVKLTVADTGIGMDEEVKARLFEPFFTTKERGHGTGLGLATVYGIVKQSGGSIWVDSEPGAGAAFTIFLPVAGAETGGAAASEAPAGG